LEKRSESVVVSEDAVNWSQLFKKPTKDLLAYAR